MMNMTTEHADWQLDQVPFCCHPWPEVIIYDNRTEFIGCNFQELLKRYSIKDKLTTVKNLQVNSLVKYFQCPLDGQLWTMVLFSKKAIFMKIWTLWSKKQLMQYEQLSHQTHHLLHHNLHLDVTLSFANKWWLIGIVSNNFAKLKMKRTMQKKTRNVKHTFHMRDLVLFFIAVYESHTKHKLQSPNEGPHPITDIFTNRTVSIRFSHANKIVSICFI